MKYIENDYSKNLMRLNKILYDIQSEKENRKPYVIISRFKRYIKALLELFKIRKQGLRKTVTNFYWNIKESRIINYTIPYNPEDTKEFDELEYNLNGKRMVVYTAVFGGYDNIKQPMFKSDSCDYYAITDQEIQTDGVWKKYDVSKLGKDFMSMDNYHKSKYVKLHPEILFPEYDYSMWVDGNVLIVADVIPLFIRAEQWMMSTFENPLHDDIYTEARFCIYHNAVKEEDIHKQIKEYREKGFPKHYGMREFSIIIRKHNDELCVRLMNEWWREVNRMTMRDQISFPYILWRNNLPIDTIHSLGGTWRTNPRFRFIEHNVNHKYS
ncbi:glycosyltransferase domain-containing protein [Selenomonas ruminantium]|uniref:glycosyltransferase domain-containing protein n=1 Tax=Selenomonas ruminantium TaxID=971 RepID=UPI0026ECABDA|nr:glycosyltransferase domain-containing protein [Selenomonas ruminantium]